MSLLIKIYRPNDHPKFPEGGKLTPWLESLEINKFIQISGPYGKLDYKGKGLVAYHNIYNGENVQKKFKMICLIGGGTGLAPLF